MDSWQLARRLSLNLSSPFEFKPEINISSKFRLSRQKFVHTRSAITLIRSQKSLSLFSRLDLAVVSVTGALQGRLSVFPAVAMSFIFQILSNLILYYYYHSHGYSFTFVCFFSLSLPILTEIRVLKLLDKWCLTIPRCCLAVDRKETSA